MLRCLLLILAQATAARAQWNVLLISIDTLRADHLGCYGYRSGVSPTIDRLARESIVFDRAFTPVPLTLPAHVSMLTGTYPRTHGVHDNGENLPPGVPTLAEKFRAGGYETAAFIGAFVLDRRFGLSRGFDEYWGSFDLHRHAGDDPGAVQIRGEEVAAAAEKWIRKPRSKPYFAFVHFYDLHGPFLLPNGTYDGEIAHVDGLIDVLWKAVDDGHTLLAITADHGEGLGDHGENNHGFLLYHATTRIPMLLRFPDGRGAGRRIPAVVRLIDLAPTLLAAVNLAPPPQIEGTNLLSAAEPSHLIAYTETLYAYRHFHTAPLVASDDDSYSYIQAPRPELYDNRADFAQRRDVAATSARQVSDLRDQLRPFAEAMARSAVPQPSPEVAAKLKSLGYLSGGSRGAGGLADPKDRIALFRRYQDALAQGDPAKLEAVLAADPALVGAHIEAGLALQRLHRDSEAIHHFGAALRVDPQNALAHYDLGISLGNLHQDDKAERELEVATTLQPWFSRAHVARGLALARLGKIPEAMVCLNKALEIDPDDFDALFNRGNLLGSQQQWSGARRDLMRASVIEPKSAAVHQALGTLALFTGDSNAALREYKEAVALDPKSSSAHSGLGLLYRRMGMEKEAQEELHEAQRLGGAGF
jgi:arylsulfatase A-like enzyme/Flp pilus assembly protein TadD